MENRMSALEGRFDSMEAMLMEMRAEMRGRARNGSRDRGRRIVNRDREKRGNQRRSSESSHSVNGSRETSEDESEEEREDVQKSWMKRVELPTFEGTDPTGWIARAEKFFEIQSVTEKEQMKLVYICMEGEANHWFRFWRKKVKKPTWATLTEAMVRRFGGRHRGTIFEKLAAVRQRESVEEYVREFEILVSQATEVTEEQLLGYFFAGLQEELRDLVRPYNPRDLLTAMERARDVEQSGLVARVTRGGAVSKGGPTWGKYTGSAGTVARTEIYRGSSEGCANSSGGLSQKKEATTRTAGSKVESTSGGSGPNRGLQMLPYPEYLKRREEGPCFHCGGPYSPGHRCAERSLKVMILGADDDEAEGAEAEEEAEQRCMELSVYSAGGISQSNTMKLSGWIRDRRVVVLIDSPH
ncbi:hypothetical protein LR48_Vigan01g267000 [Vigna angularis]|uniref:Retrotransposon gag domain-containing protein n=1 Tax=Phaseolus angularis TaxID=3914 RepID=A0A0L9TSH7_PHAAN|nr:hypothetical protein LR48_Vigan01g267000 [Vigna angularis]